MSIVLDGTRGLTFPSGNTQSDAGLVTAGGTISGNLSFATGTNGIIFNNSSATTNSTLNDYEVGTWTVADASGAGVSLTANTGGYVKIGQMVYFWFDVAIGSTASGTQALFTLPFTGATGVGDGSQGGACINYTSKGGVLAYVYGSKVYTYITSSGNPLLWSTISGTEFAVSGFYKASF